MLEPRWCSGKKFENLGIFFFEHNDISREILEFLEGNYYVWCFVHQNSVNLTFLPGNLTFPQPWIKTDHI